MQPRYILIKSQNPDFIQALLFQIKEIKHIRFFYFKSNGFYTITIQCYNYYNSKNTFDENKLYGSYIFLYSVLSIMLSDLLITHYEHGLTRRMLHARNLNSKELAKLSNISALLLDENSPLEFSEILYKRRKNCLLDALFKNFRSRNFVFVDNFLDFNAPEYQSEVLKIVEASIEILENDVLYRYMMSFIFHNQ